MMSHELRTPLNAIDGYTELLELGLHGPVTAHQLEDLRRIRAASRHLLGIINGVLEQAQLESRQVTFLSDVIPVSELRAEVEAIVLPLAAARQLTFTSAPAAPGLAVHADRDRVRQVLLNLVSNALKFTACGGVRLESRAVGEHVEIAVHDTGCGIDAAQLERIFEPFVQVDARAAGRSEGVGLGLAISRDLARGMGGDLTATSTPGQGSIFTLRLPRAMPPEG
jgi:signal transduction histidine kinase